MDNYVESVDLSIKIWIKGYPQPKNMWISVKSKNIQKTNLVNNVM